MCGCLCVCVRQDQAFGELEKNSDKLQQRTSSSDSSQPAHLHQLLCSLQKQLLAYCHINSVSEVPTACPSTTHSVFFKSHIKGRVIIMKLRTFSF